MELAAADFAAFFRAVHSDRAVRGDRAVHGDDPFPWQQALVDHLAKYDEWPGDGVLDLPTGSGKTAALDAAVFHLALRFECPARAALRIAFVVDRRLVVDDAYGRAKKIARLLENPENAPEDQRRVVAEVARRLQHLAGEGEPPLVARRLRGGAPLEPDWARTPTQPTILCSTVDQVGSRLLFRGYGVSNRMKPVHAGLLGTHCLILLDEAHLSEPFRQTLQAVQKMGESLPSEAVQKMGASGVRTVLLSATPGASSTRPFELTKKDYAHRVLKARLEANKPATLKGVSGDPVDFVKAASGIADRLRQAGVSVPAIGVVVNRVGLARSIFEKLKEREKETASETVLMIGRSRDIGRERIVEGIAPFKTGGSRRRRTLADGAGTADDDRLPFDDSSADAAAGPLFVVATQCLEVGVDLDLDGLVTQAAPLDALRQRFGRVNRAGRNVPAEGAVLALQEDVAKKADDAIYGDRIVKTWDVLQRMAHDKKVDFGIREIDRRLHDLAEDVSELAALRAPAPVLMPAYLDLWSQTSPPPASDPEVGLFLHGVERASADVSLVWRGDVTEADLKQGAEIDLTDLLSLVPPRAAEMVEVPLWSARAWLRQPRDSEPLTRIADVAQRDDDAETGRPGGGGRRAFRWAGENDPRTGPVRPQDLRPGDVLVVPAAYGGCDEFGWAPAFDKPVTDAADEAALPFRRRRHTVRVARDIAASDNEWGRLAAVLEDEGVAGADLVERLLDVLPIERAADLDEGDGTGKGEVIGGGETEPVQDRHDSDRTSLRPVRGVLEALLRARKKRIVKHFPYAGDAAGGAVLEAPYGLLEDGAPTRKKSAEGGPATEDDRLSQTGNAVSIDDHTDHVVESVTGFSCGLGLPPTVASDLEIAAFLHDAGKADRRFQNLLSGGDLWNRPAGAAMAKSGQPSPRGAWKRAGLPKGWRHEALSVRMALTHPRFADARDPALVLWLIGTHHGFGRPFFDFADPHEGGPGHDGCVGCLTVEPWRPAPAPGPQSLAFDLDGVDWAATYEALKRRYGVWGLAHLETILRLADHRASESERENA